MLLPEVVARVEGWATQYSVLDSRYKFLVLRAPSRAGKSTWAKCIHLVLPKYIQKPPFIQTVQGATAAELQHYDRDSHGFILFGNCNSLSFVLSRRALFLANPDCHRLGQSQTNIFSYQIYLFRVPIVTIDESTDWDDEELPIFHLGSPRKMDPTKCQVSFGKLRKKLFSGDLVGSVLYILKGPSKVANCHEEPWTRENQHLVQLTGPCYHLDWQPGGCRLCNLLFWLRRRAERSHGVLKGMAWDRFVKPPAGEIWVYSCLNPQCISNIIEYIVFFFLNHIICYLYHKF